MFVKKKSSHFQRKKERLVFWTSPMLNCSNRSVLKGMLALLASAAVVFA